MSNAAEVWEMAKDMVLSGEVGSVLMVIDAREWNALADLRSAANLGALDVFLLAANLLSRVRPQFDELASSRLEAQRQPVEVLYTDRGRELMVIHGLEIPT